MSMYDEYPVQSVPDDFNAPAHKIELSTSRLSWYSKVLQSADKIGGVRGKELRLEAFAIRREWEHKEEH